jgi:hypothetical protein
MWKEMQMQYLRSNWLIVLAILIGTTLAGCGGGGGDSTSQVPPAPGTSAPTLAWDPPSTYADNTAMDPYRELDYYEIYLRQDSNFADNEAPVAQVAAITNTVGADGVSTRQELTTSFSLGSLIPFTQPGAVYYLSIKSVGVDGLKSAFSPPVVWHLS